MHFIDLDEAVNLGGHRFTLDDLAYLQRSVLDAVQAMAYIHGSGGNPAILSDLQITDNGTTFDLEKPAMVYYSGKVWEVDPEYGVTKGTGGEFKFQLFTEVNPNNPVTYGSGEQFNIHKNQKMKLVYTNLTGSDYVPLTAFTGSSWIPYTPTISADITFAGPGEHLNCRYRVQGKTLYLSVDFIGQFDVNNAPSITMPYGYKAKYNGNTLLASRTSPGSAGAIDIIRSSWNIDDNEIRFGNTEGGLLAAGAVEIHDTLIFEIA